MINEKMSELLILIFLMNTLKPENLEKVDGVETFELSNGKNYNFDKLSKRAETLLSEFLEPYAI